MKISEFTSLLREHPEAELQFVLPDGGFIAAHAHVTEVGRVEKLFIDCGGKPRRLAACTLQVWDYTDTEHRLTPAKLAGIMEKGAPMFGGEDMPVEIEYQDTVISQYPVEKGYFADGRLTFEVSTKQTACLAMELCVPDEAGEECCGTSGCC